MQTHAERLRPSDKSRLCPEGAAVRSLMGRSPFDPRLTIQHDVRVILSFQHIVKDVRLCPVGLFSELNSFRLRSKAPREA